MEQTTNTETDDDEEDDEYYYEPENDEELNDDEPITQSEIDEITGVPAENNESNHDDEEQDIIENPIEPQPNEQPREISDTESTQLSEASETRRSNRETRPVERLTYSHMNAKKLTILMEKQIIKRKQKRLHLQKILLFTIKKKSTVIILLCKNMKIKVNIQKGKH